MIEGKTKRLTPGPQAGTIIMEAKDELTGGDAAKRAHIAGIAVHKTEQTSNVFTLLKRKGIDTAFIERNSPTALLCDDCDMLPLELVMRRYAFGSVLKREPRYKTNGAPLRFDEVACEFFHKWAVVMPPLVDKPEQMEEGAARERYLRDGVWADGVYTDPFVHIDGGRWMLHPAKVPFDAAKPLMETKPVCSEDERRMILRQLMLPCFEALEKAWAAIHTEHGPVALADIKIEVGRRKRDGRIVIADVIDNDSWRIWPGADPSKQLDKQSFRDGSDLNLVSDNYALVAELTRRFLEG
jgi:phosphoribosylaminoimidazole-succinocarboxamide synthase